MIEDHGLQEWGQCKAEDEFIYGGKIVKAKWI